MFLGIWWFCLRLGLTGAADWLLLLTLARGLVCAQGDLVRAFPGSFSCVDQERNSLVLTFFGEVLVARFRALVCSRRLCVLACSRWLAWRVLPDRVVVVVARLLIRLSGLPIRLP